MMILSGIVLFLAGVSFALTTDELLQLKQAGVSEDVILFMVEANYTDVDRVVKLKGAGFKDETILSIIKNDLKDRHSAAPSTGEMKRDVAGKSDEKGTTSKIKIMWYVSYGGGPVLLAKQEEDNAMIIVEAEALKFEWEDKSAFNILLKKPFRSPFFWDINKDDTLGPGGKGFTYMLQSTMNRKGRPDTDGSHYWVVYLDPNDTKIVDYVKKVLSNK